MALFRNCVDIDSSGNVVESGCVGENMPVYISPFFQYSTGYWNICIHLSGTLMEEFYCCEYFYILRFVTFRMALLAVLATL